MRCERKKRDKGAVVVEPKKLSQESIQALARLAKSHRDNPDLRRLLAESLEAEGIIEPERGEVLEHIYRAAGQGYLS